MPGCRLINGYGPTENTTFTCTYAVEADDALEPSVPIGRPIAGTTAYVLDAQMNPVPVGVTGELYIGGAGLARGYLNRPDLTARAFVADPFDPAPGARLYRSGDLVRWRDDGTLQFLGRADRQVKLRGHRIEPDEVEAALGRHPAVRQAAVAARGAGEDRRLVAYCAFAGQAPPAEAIRAFLRNSLPAYMIPDAVLAVDAIPMTEFGKIDRDALPDVDAPGTVRPDGALPPRTPVEEALAGIWCDLMGLDRVGVNESFFDLGGHSLLAIRMLFRIQEDFAIELPLHSVFETPTIEGLALSLVERMVAAEGSRIDA
jgi:acyl-coenzyme A synthetase/AMP-(fatty) acid ligase/acyl carrier protein